MFRIISVIVLSISLFLSCSSTSSSASQSEETKEENLPIVYPKTICFPLGYPTFNISNDEDIKLLIKEHHDFLKEFFDISVQEYLPTKQFQLVTTDQNCTYQLLIKELAFKEFKLEVDGPTVNVATVRADYEFISPQLDTLLFAEINKESIPPFEETVFQDMCNELAVKIVDKIDQLTIKQ